MFGFNMGNTDNARLEIDFDRTNEQLHLVKHIRDKRQDIDEATRSKDTMQSRTRKVIERAHLYDHMARHDDAAAHDETSYLDCLHGSIGATCLIAARMMIIHGPTMLRLMKMKRRLQEKGRGREYLVHRDGASEDDRSSGNGSLFSLGVDLAWPAFSRLALQPHHHWHTSSLVRSKDSIVLE
jgi:hypothetical protein